MTTVPITTWDEPAVAEWLFLDPAPAWTLGQWLHLPSPRLTRFRMPTRPFPRAHLGPGDIDVLAVHPTRPDRAVAFECKRITVRPEVFDTEFPPPSKLPDFTGGYEQANRLRRMGFHRVFLLGIVEIDCTERAHLGGLTGPLVRVLELACPLDQLRRGVGLAFVELAQFDKDRGIEWLGGVGVKVVKNAWTFRQPKALTAHIESLLSASHHPQPEQSQ